MIPGTAAEQLLLVQNGGALTSLAAIDFVNGTYVVNGVIVTDADVVSDTGRIDINGYSITGTFAGAASLINDLANLIMSNNWIIVVEFYPTADTGNLYFIDSVKGDNNDETVLYLGGGSGILYDLHGFFDANPFAERTVFGVGTNNLNMINRVAYLRTDSLGALSLNGETAQFDDTDTVGVILENVYFAYKSGTAAGYIRKIDVYSGGSVSDLATLSS